MAAPGISTLGVEFGYGIGTTTVKPTAFTKLNRINNIAGISLETEQIDASALEDYVTRYVAGRQDTGGTFPITVNVTDDTIAEWTQLISDYNSKLTTECMWFEVWSPYLTNAFYIIAQPPQVIPMPEQGQNSLMTVEISLIIDTYVGLDVANRPV